MGPTFAKKHEFSKVLENGHHLSFNSLMNSHPSESPAVDRVVRRRQQELELLLKQMPANSAAYLELAQIYRDQDRHHEAAHVLQRAICYSPNEPEVRWQLEEAQLAQALQRLRSATEVELMQTNTSNREDVERAKINWANCRRNVCKARLNRDPTQMGLRVVLAESLRDLGDFEEAIRETEIAIRTMDVAPQAFLIRGQCFLAMDRPLEALSAWRSAALRRSVPAPEATKVAALQAAADTSLKHGLYSSAKRYLDELQCLLPEDANVREALIKLEQLNVDSDDEMIPSVSI